MFYNKTYEILKSIHSILSEYFELLIVILKNGNSLFKLKLFLIHSFNFLFVVLFYRWFLLWNKNNVEKQNTWRRNDTKTSAKWNGGKTGTDYGLFSSNCTNTYKSLTQTKSNMKCRTAKIVLHLRGIKQINLFIYESERYQSPTEFRASVSAG